MKKLILAFLVLGALSGCAGYKAACDAINGKFDPATGNCDKNLFN